jgi:hypothetical protein
VRKILRALLIPLKFLRRLLCTHSVQEIKEDILMDKDKMSLFMYTICARCKKDVIPSVKSMMEMMSKADYWAGCGHNTSMEKKNRND